MASKLYRIIDPSLKSINGKQITQADRDNGVLLSDAQAEWYLANSQIVYAYDQPGTDPVPDQSLPISYLPGVTTADNGKYFGFRVIDGRMAVVELVGWTPEAGGITPPIPSDPVASLALSLDLGSSLAL